jgi:L-2,4-diaminobutyric acid acetyltransferase
MALPGHQPDERAAPHLGEPDTINFRIPRAEDGPGIHQLIAACPPLDTNSLYCNLLQVSHFADCCVLAESRDGIVGWISGYRLPSDPQVLFVWQVAVGATMRGQGLGRRMLTQLLARPALADIRTLTTTITPSNQASWALFQGFARSLNAALQHRPHFHCDQHFAGAHETEHLVTIGPLPALRAAA